MIMQAVVIDVQWERLLVLDLDTRQQVQVNTPDARQFRPGDFILIWYNGVMTRSIPPQITAQRIVMMPTGTYPPAVRPPVIRPPVIFPPVVIRPPIGRPPIGRPPIGRPPDHRPGPRPPDHRPGPRPPRDHRR